MTSTNWSHDWGGQVAYSYAAAHPSGVENICQLIVFYHIADVLKLS